MYSRMHTLYKITSKRGQPLYKGQMGGSQWCPLFGGSTVALLARLLSLPLVLTLALALALAH